MKKCINLKPHEAAALVRGETITIWRVVKPSPPIDAPLPTKLNGILWTFGIFDKAWREPFPLNVPLLGKETWHFCEGGAVYDAAGGMMDSADPEVTYKADAQNQCRKWRSASQMPPWAVRTLVTLSDVRVRKPCDVTPQEALSLDEKIDWHLYHWSYTATPSKNLS